MKHRPKTDKITFDLDAESKKAFIAVCVRNKSTHAAMLRKFVDFVIASEIQQYFIPKDEAYNKQDRNVDYANYFAQTQLK